MSISFLNPHFLFGLAAGIIPILIHRLTKRNAALRPFSAVRLLLRSQQVMARPQRLKHLLLLALRVLAVLGLVFMLARPVLTNPGFLAGGNERPKIVIIDNSLSMGYREDGGERFALGKRAAREAIEGGRGKVLVIPTAPFQGQRIEDRETGWLSSQEALRELDRIHLSFGRGDPVRAMDMAYRKLKELKAPGEILILSDATAGDWEGFHLSRIEEISGESGITFIRMGGPSRDSNLAIKEAMLTQGDAVAGIPLRLETTVSNLSDQSGSTVVELHLAGVKKDQKSITLKPGEEGRVYFDLSFDKAGWVNGEVRLSGDRFSPDDAFCFSVKVRDKVRVLIVDGDPRTSLRAGESYYLASALHPALQSGGTEGSPFGVRVVTDAGLNVQDLKSYDALFFLNVARPQASQLVSFLESGKPVFLFLGDRVVPDEYNAIPLFPWRILGIREAGPSKPETIARIDMNHEGLKPFSGPGGESLKKASFHRYFKIEGSKKDLLTFGNRDPLLAEADLGKGRLFLFASSADLDWNDLPLKAAYLPFIQGLVKEAVGLHRGSLSKGIRIGQSFEEKGQPVQMTGSKGGPGIYQWLLPRGEVRWSLNPPVEESDLGKVTPEELKKRFGSIEVKVVEYKEGAINSLHAEKRELWPFVLALLLIILAVEMVVANWIPSAPRSPSPSEAVS